MFASLAGSQGEALSFRTWETEPAGWYRLSGGAGRYTVVFSSPAHFARPVVLTNVFTRDGDAVQRAIHPRFDVAELDDASWDHEPANGYYQLFTAGGTSITQVGFKLATDGVDGAGPGSQTLLVSIHRKGTSAPDAWEQVGPTAHAPGVDCGGPKSYWFSVGWGSGEVPTEPGGTYAVHLRPEGAARTIQAFWRESADPREDCYRVREGKGGFAGRRLWMAVGSDGDGIVISYPKRVHKQFHELTRFGKKWTQTYVARGRCLASVILYAAVSGAQPPLSRQRVRIRVRHGGPDGPVVGIEKIAVGNGNYTGDASWGAFGAAFAPGEVPVTPGEKYAIELASIESYHTLHGFVNIKGEVSNDRPGFNPYRKCPPDTYAEGAAYYLGTEPVDYDLDLQILEYENECEGWNKAVEEKNLLSNGDMESGDFHEKEPAKGRPEAWRSFAVDAGTVHHYLLDESPPAPTVPAPHTPRGRIARIIGGDAGRTIDGGYVQRVDGLSRADTYRLSGQVRSSWPLDVDHQCRVGYDPTGQTNDPGAKTIVWTLLPPIHGEFVACSSEPIRPGADAISVWLRVQSRKAEKFPFTADFDDFVLRRVVLTPPR